MWCRQCQQDVPALARSSAGPLVCPRCSQELKSVHERQGEREHDALDGQEQAVDDFDLPSPGLTLRNEASERRLQQLGRHLRTNFKEVKTWEPIPRIASPFGKPASGGQQGTGTFQAIAKQAQREQEVAQKPNWILSSLLAAGIAGLALGLFLLTAAAAFSLNQLWQWGMTVTIASEGFLILGLTWMALRLWQNGRRINRNLRDMDHQLDEIHSLAGSLSAERLSASQHYYRQYNQVASPHFLVANLRGQVDQLAERLAG